MKSITSQDIKQAINTMVKNNGNGTVYQEVATSENGDTLYLVFGYMDGYDKGEKYQIIENDNVYTLCGKLAINVSSLQCDYDVDWYMPYGENGDVYDTDTAITDDLQGLAEWYNQEAKTIIAMLNSGELKIDY